jgi:hypothetical protein
MEIKIGRKTYKVKEGDYIIFNGACYQFCAGDGRILKQEGFNSYRSLVMPKTAVKKIDFSKLEKKEIVSSGVSLTKWVLK